MENNIIDIWGSLELFFTNIGLYVNSTYIYLTTSVYSAMWAKYLFGGIIFYILFIIPEPNSDKGK